MSNKSISIQLEGRVQKVGFRYHVYRLASELGVKGFVKNLPDGSVYVEAESDEEKLHVFVEHCKKGPPLSKINKININELPNRNFTSFNIY